jgi:hypothetical protein
VFYLNFTPKDAVLSPVHIPSGTTACESCHAVSFTTFSGTTMSSAKHTLMFAVIGKTCDQCHDAKTLTFYGVSNLTTRPNGHHTGQDCNGCHNTNNWSGGAATAGRTVTAKVSAGVVTARVASPTAATASPTAATGTGLAARLAAPAVRLASTSHIGVTASCYSCHNGVLASGKGAAHIASNNVCQNCHITSAWVPARFEHQGVTAACSTCHNGVIAAGKSLHHISTSQECSVCHGTVAWSAVTFSHLNLSASCTSCHNGAAAIGKQPNHPLTTKDCATCHNTQSWTVVVPKAPLRPLLKPRVR